MTGTRTSWMLKELENFDTPSIANVVATNATGSFGLALYDPWNGDWYTDDTIKCMYPELGSKAGHAVTCVYGPADPANPSQLTFMDVIEALDEAPKPTILVLQQDFPPELAGRVGLAGGNMVSAMRAVGCVGLISNGPSRDLDEVRLMRFQYMLTGVTAGHGPQAVKAVNVPVSVGGMDVEPGDVVHMDENGAVKFPPEELQAVLNNARALREAEEGRIAALQAATSAADVRAIMSGHAYTASEGARPRPRP